MAKLPSRKGIAMASLRTCTCGRQVSEVTVYRVNGGTQILEVHDDDLTNACDVIKEGA